MLGCQLQTNLKWQKQLQYLLDKLKKRLVGLTSMKYIVRFNTRKTLTLGMFNSVLVYCLPLFGGCDVGDIKQLQILQNRAAQIVTHAPPRAHRQDMFDKLDWLTVHQLIAYHTLISIYKIRKSGEPEYLARFLRDENRGGKIILQNTHLTLARRSFIWRGSQQWNLLSVELRRSTKISLFKKGARSWVVENISQFLD